MKTSRISLHQMFTLLVLFLSSSATLTSVGRYSGQDIWIVFLISSVLGTILYTLYYRISKLNEFEPLPNILKETFGKWLGTLLNIGYIGYFFYITTGLLKSIGDMIGISLMVDASMILILVLLMIPVVYGMIIGVNTIGRSSELLFYVVCICFVTLLFAVFSSDVFQFDNFLPVLEHGFDGIKTDIYRVTLFPYGEAITFLLIFPLIPSQGRGKILKYSYVGIGVATIILLGTNVMNVGILGADLMKNFLYPFYNSMKMVGINVIFERLDPIAIIILMTSCFFKLSIYFYATLVSLEKLVVRFNYRQLALFCSVLLIIASLFISKSHVETIYLAIIGITKWILPIFQVALPLLIWMISEVKNRMKKT